MAPPWEGRGAKGSTGQSMPCLEPGMGWGQAQPLLALSSSTGSNTGHSQPGLDPAAALSPLPVTPSLGALRIPVGAFPALPWMELEQNLSSCTEPILLNQGFQHLELLGTSRSWTWRCGASLAWLCSTGSLGECHGHREGWPRGGGTGVWLPPWGVSVQAKQGLDLLCGHLHAQAAEMQLCLCLCILSPL